MTPVPFALAPLIVGLALAAAGDDDAGDVEKLVRRLAAEHGHEAPLDAALSHLEGVSARHPVARRLERVVAALDDPFSGAAVAAELRDALASPLRDTKRPGYAALLDASAAWSDAALVADDLPPLAADTLAALDAVAAECTDPALTGHELLLALSRFCRLGNEAIDLALAAFDGEERAELARLAPRVLEGWHRTHFPGETLEPQLASDLSRGLAMLQAVDRRLLFATSQRVAALLEPAFTTTLGKRLSPLAKSSSRQDAKGTSGISGDLLAITGEDARERVAVGGAGVTQYELSCALIVDLGGNDVYRHGAIVDPRDEAQSSLAIVIDLRGDDRYHGREIGPCAAVLGIAALLDRGGKDRYEGGRLGAAAAMGGVALLADEAGDDVYASHDFAQAFAIEGGALLLDLAGRDEFGAHAFAQGATLGVAFAALVDVAGDDVYHADGVWPDIYGNSGPNVHHGAAQGYATGIRPATPGGIAALLDLAGADRYQAGNFSQGGGYYFGFGLMHDGGGDDENVGTRYSQGFGVHQAVGVRWDAGGDDVYRCRTVANLGSAWDEGVGFFLEDGGDDRYEAGGLSLGAAANTGLAIFVDASGNDDYRGPSAPDSQGGTGDASYHEKPACALLLDLGDGKDVYARQECGDRRIRADAGVALFADVKARTIAELLARKSLTDPP
jgi:hypothetical protein